MEIKSQSHNILKGYNLLLYFAGSMVMYEPNEECIIDFWQQGIIRKLPVMSTNPKFNLAASQLRQSCENRAQCLDELRKDYFRLFVNEGAPMAAAYESVYTGGKGTDGSSGVSDFYASYGWVSKYTGKIKDDHLGVELLFLTILVEKYLVMDDQVCLVEIRSEIRRFIDSHILPWIGRWNAKMQENADSMCYKGVATLINACVEDIYSLCDNNQVAAYSTQYLKN
jgi:TorA maturation chaperone TorD